MMCRLAPVILLFVVTSVTILPSLIRADPQDHAAPAGADVVEPPVFPPSPAPSPTTAPEDPLHHLDLREGLTDTVSDLLSELRSTARSFPDSVEDRLKLADALYRIGDIESAIDEYRAVITLKPDHAKAHLQLGVALMAKQDWRIALNELKEATRLNPELAQAHYNLGTVYYTIGNLKAAIQSYRQALELQASFPDARYRLALVLKLARRDQESAQFMEEAALGGVPQAQYFLGNAYRTGQGVEKNSALAVYWWTKAVEFGHQLAAASLSQLRRQALSSTQSEKKRREALDAFQAYRDKLWENFPDPTRTGDSETLGTTLLKQNRTDSAVSVLLQEGYALSDVAQAELARLYEMGWEQHLPPFDKKILTCFETTAGEGFMPSKKILARIYGKGLGVTPDVPKAKTLLKGLPKNDIKAVLDEFALQP